MRDPGGRNAKNAAEIRGLAEGVAAGACFGDGCDRRCFRRARCGGAVAKAGRLDVAINNAGYYLSGLEEAVTTEQARRLMDTNFLAWCA